MWTDRHNYVTQNNSYAQLLAMLCMFQTLLYGLHQTSAQRFMKPAVVHDFCGSKMPLQFAIALPKLDWEVQGVISSWLFSRAIPGNPACMLYYGKYFCTFYIHFYL